MEPEIFVVAVFVVILLLAVSGRDSQLEIENEAYKTALIGIQNRQRPDSPGSGLGVLLLAAVIVIAIVVVAAGL